MLKVKQLAKDRKMKKKEKELESVLKSYRSKYALLHPQWANDEVREANMKDEEVTAEVAKAILETACLVPQEQFKKMSGAGHTFWWARVTDAWPIADIAGRLIHDISAAKSLLCEFVASTFPKGDDNAAILCTRIQDGKFIHFQMTKTSKGGHDAYIVFRIPKTRAAVIVRICTTKDKIVTVEHRSTKEPAR